MVLSGCLSTRKVNQYERPCHSRLLARVSERKDLPIQLCHSSYLSLHGHCSHSLPNHFLPSSQRSKVSVQRKDSLLPVVVVDVHCENHSRPHEVYYVVSNGQVFDRTLYCFEKGLQGTLENVRQVKTRKRRAVHPDEVTSRGMHLLVEESDQSQVTMGRWVESDHPVLTCWTKENSFASIRAEKVGGARREEDVELGEGSTS